ncbi:MULTISPECIES: TraB/GumN family protein [Halomonas]|uniref:Pheromone shutdown protein n=1 Tax=Halomonas halophila TaxID=29573 RepID=A0ABQ0U3M7_9GAMM|nr:MULTISPECIES: TraB/GumN family protein [Halomonas]MDR5888526.1 TraB/GumN family protein [Halomonas salina]RAH37839.1 TraB family protein [Halomonas sp. SL1]WJY07708.1 TraB/GumN family protein [Halomonas halophila]GEK73005.1 pheromone shutdown protein [Halomonas halophila]
MTDSQDTATVDREQAAGGGPRRTLKVGETRYTLLGTAHVSAESATEVRELIDSGEFDAVAIELCDSRHQNLANPDALGEQDLFQIFRQGKAGMVAASLALGAFQQRVAEQSGIEPGAEMRAALEASQARNLPLLLIDRDVGVTLKRIYHNVPWWQRFSLFSGLLGGVLSRQDVSAADIERLKEGDVLESTFSEFASESETLYTPLISERDRYMVLRLAEQCPPGRYRHVLVVIGAGHLKGMAEHLEQPLPEAPTPERETLEATPPPTKVWKALPWLITALVLTGFAIGFSRNTELGWQLVAEWFLINGVLSGAATLVALAHPLTVIATVFAAPLTSLNPTIGAGFVAAGVELAMRKPKVRDFATLRHDVTEVKGWWRNRVSRTLLVFLTATLGSAAGTWIAGFRIAGALFGG